jgi:major type 1 subunit fimbrin (pilin)
MAAMALPLAGRASDGSILFVGAVTENSCTVQVNGEGSDGSVALPVVDTSALRGMPAPRNTAAGTFFRIVVSGCAANQPDIAGHTPGGVAIYFEAGPNVDAATSALINAGTSNVEVRLYQASGATQVGAQITPGVVGAGQSASLRMTGTSTTYFYAGYSTVPGVAATAGTVRAAVTYSLVYQ